MVIILPQKQRLLEEDYINMPLPAVEASLLLCQRAASRRLLSMVWGRTLLRLLLGVGVGSNWETQHRSRAMGWALALLQCSCRRWEQHGLGHLRSE